MPGAGNMEPGTGNKTKEAKNIKIIVETEAETMRNIRTINLLQKLAVRMGALLSCKGWLYCGM